MALTFKKIFFRNHKRARRSMTILFLGLAIFCSRCATTSSAFDQNFNQLSLGMDVSKARELLGEPKLKEAKENTEVWHFSQSDGRFVKFSSGKISAFGKDDGASLLAADASASGSNANAVGFTQTPPIAPQSRLIGEDCIKDINCKQGNCHFKICSGLNNCQKTAGQVCAVDEDCCESRCDFGHCKKR